MIQAKSNRSTAELAPYVESFNRFEKQTLQSPSWVAPIRRAGITRFAELGFPTLQDEDWRYTNVAPIAKLPFKPAHEYSHSLVTAETLERFPLASFKENRLVFINGIYSQELSKLQPQKNGVRIVNLSSALKSDAELLQKLMGTHIPAQENAFLALNSAFFNDGAFIYVPAGIAIEEPVQLLYLSTATEAGVTSSPRNLIVAEKASQVTVIESYVSTHDAAYFTNAVTELIARENAVVEHCKFQDESLQAYHMATLHVHTGRNANVVSHSIALGGRISRNNIRTALAGENVECILNGLYLTKDDQVADHHMVVEHAQPHCNSHEYFNGILDDRSRGVFHGRILVQPIAQKTDAKQTNKNLLLSDEATADTKPQLEIYADDVKCTHGATVGQLNEESIFYLRARGIGLETARRMLIHSFAGEIISRVRCRSLREELDTLVWDRLEANPHVAETR